MSDRVAITCVIPTHNRCDLLQESIASVLKQTTDRTYDIMVVDDVGNDATRATVQRAAEMHNTDVRYFARSGPNGASASRNFVMSTTSGDYLGFLDDDDLWDPAFLEEAVKALEASGADMAITWLSVLDLDGEVYPLYRLPRDVTVEDAGAWNFGFTGSNFVIKRRVFEVIGGFDTDLPVSNDKDFFLRFLLAGFQYAVVPKYLAVHRRHHGPQLTTRDERRAAGIEAYLRKHDPVLGVRGKRFLRLRIHRIRLHTAPTRWGRFLHALGFVANLSFEDVKSKWRRRDGRYAALR